MSTKQKMTGRLLVLLILYVSVGSSLRPQNHSFDSSRSNSGPLIESTTVNQKNSSTVYPFGSNSSSSMTVAIISSSQTVGDAAGGSSILQSSMTTDINLIPLTSRGPIIDSSSSVLSSESFLNSSKISPTSSWKESKISVGKTTALSGFLDASSAFNNTAVTLTFTELNSPNLHTSSWMQHKNSGEILTSKIEATSLHEDQASIIIDSIVPSSPSLLVTKYTEENSKVLVQQVSPTPVVVNEIRSAKSDITNVFLWLFGNCSLFEKEHLVLESEIFNLVTSVSSDVNQSVNIDDVECSNGNINVSLTVRGAEMADKLSNVMRASSQTVFYVGEDAIILKGLYFNNETSNSTRTDFQFSFRHEDVEFLVHIAAGTFSVAICLIAIVYLILNRCCKEKKTKNNNLESPVVNLEDYTLTPIPRSAMTYVDYYRNAGIDRYWPLDDSTMTRSHTSQSFIQPPKERENYPNAVNLINYRKHPSNIYILSDNTDGSLRSTQRTRLTSPREENTTEGLDNPNFWQ